MKDCSELSYEKVDVSHLPTIPAMITDAESKFLYFSVKNAYEGVGAVVEIGTWLGSSTVHLAGGLKASSAKGLIYCFDDYVWRKGMDKKSSLVLSPGESFFSFFKNNTQSFSEFILPTVCQASKIQWDNSIPVELMHIDAPKSWRELAATLKCFSQALIPGKSVFLFQDYLHFPSYEIALLINQLPLQLERVILPGWTAVFRVIESLPDAESSIWKNFSKCWDVERYMKEWDDILVRLPEKASFSLQPAVPLGLITLGRTDLAENYLSDMVFNQKRQSYCMRKLSGDIQSHVIYKKILQNIKMPQP